jgi:hypothetical protein
MYFREWLVHVFKWISYFPRPGIDEHLWVAPEDDLTRPVCMICHATALEDGQGKFWRTN